MAENFSHWTTENFSSERAAVMMLVTLRSVVMQHALTIHCSPLRALAGVARGGSRPSRYLPTIGRGGPHGGVTRSFAGSKP
jgi:hypothetical protein